ncbi:Wyosine base formation domain protein [Segniliparus rotundus DSM 44985]|uniref:Wyosine base formation domain protein n=1 Tax=Segniliparus rotundus (strain ATCC BAA-972 / CDC 1076 / CIP 108378 / DSM 44985 / JCM 13578) TaxID=640132 RepID=D6ZAX4_SEGRD|nr:TIGR03084 family metal-binding protein [Segniliparus rotundus]ADG98860.1 Wyosine base formation domain protein [Segniliparus rotundus DSM 44985]
MVSPAAVLADLVAEGDAVEALVAALEPPLWRTQTPSAGWTVAHQIGHLLWTDAVAAVAVAGPDRFARLVQEKAALGAAMVDIGAQEHAARPPHELFQAWRHGRRELAEQIAALPEGAAVPWFGPPMSAASFATARLMETWAHGLDIADALGAAWPATNRLQHVAHIGVRARDYAFLVNGLTPPAEPFRVELAAPDGQTWAWGPEHAAQRVAGSALDFCHLVCQRRPPSTLGLVADGDDARRWLTVAQAFAGPPGSRREDQETTRRKAPV